MKKEIKKLEPKDRNRTIKKAKRYTIKFPSYYKSKLEKLALRYGSIKSAIEFGIRKHIQEIPYNDQKGFIWVYTMPLPEDIREGIQKRIPYEFKTISQAIMTCTIKLVENMFEET